MKLMLAVEDGCDLLHDHHADCIDAEMVEADRCDRCRRLEAAAEALDALTAWAGEMRAYLPSKAQEEIDAAEEALERLRGETP